jgi:hypothetical protein
LHPGFFSVTQNILKINLQVIFISLLQEMTGKSVILLPVGAGDDGAHSQNEKIDIRNYIEGVMRLLLNLYSPCVALLQRHMWSITAISQW